MARIIQEEDLQNIIKYLITKPYMEVAGAIQSLSILPQARGLEPEKQPLPTKEKHVSNKTV